MADEMVCAKCGSADGLYRDISVPGWQGIRVERTDTGKLVEHEDGQSDFERHRAEPEGGYGCGECDATWWPLEKGVALAVTNCPRCSGAGCPRCGYEGKTTPDEPRVHPEQTAIPVPSAAPRVEREGR